VGNVLIKFAEGVSTNILRVIREEIRANPWSTLLGLGLRPAFSRVRRRMDYAEWGGAPLLGVNGICIIGHGRSNPRAVRNAVRAAKQAVEQELIAHIRAGIGPQEPGIGSPGPEVEHDRVPMHSSEEATTQSEPLASGP
jgi:glycerol-3-phosphate acyltransferase PlsX